METREFVGITVTFVTDNLLERGDIEVHVNLTVKALQEYIKGTLEEELYDVLYYIAALSNVYDVDLENVMKLKEPISSAKYGQNGDRGSVEIESLMR